MSIANENFKFLSELIKSNLNFEISLETEDAKSLYGDCTFMIGNRKAVSRLGKLMPKKAGFFIAIWKRSPQQKAVPFDLNDPFDFIIASVKDKTGAGHFVFSKEILLRKKIISGAGARGNNGIRIYPPWITELNNQARKTQQWQQDCFLQTVGKSIVNQSKAKTLYNL